MRGFHHDRPRMPRLRQMRQRQIQPVRWTLLAPALTLLAGVLLGALAEELARAGGQAYLAYFAREVLLVYENGSFTGAAGYAFLCAFTAQTAVLLAGFSCIGAPLVLALCAARGATLGCVAAYLLGTMGARGAVTAAVLFWLPQTLELCLFLLFTREALTLSLGLFHTVVRKSGTQDVAPCIRAFLFTMLAMPLPALLAGALCALFAPVLL